ncbi:SDR family oxidoreductase [Amycolatopsis sp. NPDC051903]|uniref:SDR family oxidoreductase n=1 Tax=Amycolatopsis sp. NPDC051903 TaxID=3363936 RepID=UPI0037982B41
MTADFTDKVALVTGAGSRMGRTTALLLAERGAAVTVVGRRAGKLDEVVAEIRQPGGEAHGIRINELQPGVIDSELTQANRSVAERGIPLGRIGASREIATAIAFLLAEDASYVTGAHLAVDGGFLA